MDKNKNKQQDDFMSNTDPEGSYTGNSLIGDDVPEQDADDL